MVIQKRLQEIFRIKLAFVILLTAINTHEINEVELKQSSAVASAVRDGLAAAPSCVLGALELRVVLDLKDGLDRLSEKSNSTYSASISGSESEIWGQERAARPTVAAEGSELSVHLSLEYLEDEVLPNITPSSCSSFIFSGRHKVLVKDMQ